MVHIMDIARILINVGQLVIQLVNDAQLETHIEGPVISIV
jgi:hypothetical protein